VQAQILSGSRLLCNWLHLPQQTGTHVENKASRRDILCAGYLMSAADATQRFWYGRCSPSHGQYHCPIARPILFWLNDDSYFDAVQTLA
jgi:hypothetical protein